MESISCPICLEEYDDTQRIPQVIIPCIHTLCSACIIQLQSKSSPTCPLCRTPIERSPKTNYALLQIISDLIKSKLILSTTVVTNTSAGTISTTGTTFTTTTVTTDTTTSTVTTGTVTSTTSTTATTTVCSIPINTPVNIKSKTNGKYMNLSGGKSMNGTKIQIWDNPSSEHSKWIITPLPQNNNIFLIMNTLTGKYVNLSGGKSMNGTKIQIWDNPTSPHCHWRIVSEGDGYYTISNVDTNKCINVSGGKTANGTKIHQWDNPQSDHSQWEILPVT